MSLICPDRLFDLEVSKSNHSVRSTSGMPGDGRFWAATRSQRIAKQRRRVEPPPQKAMTRSPRRAGTFPRRMGPMDAAGPISSTNSRRALRPVSRHADFCLSVSNKRRRPCYASRGPPGWISRTRAAFSSSSPSATTTRLAIWCPWREDVPVHQPPGASRYRLRLWTSCPIGRGRPNSRSSNDPQMRH